MDFSHDNYPSYETMYNHDVEYGKKARRKLWNVFWIMLVITIAELGIGSMAPGHGWTGALWLKVLFITLTLAKAAYIVIVFMHLGHEVKFFKYIILGPYITFILYGLFIILGEGVYSGEVHHRTKVDPILAGQQQKLREEAAAHRAGGGGHETKSEGKEAAAEGHH